MRADDFGEVPMFMDDGDLPQPVASADVNRLPPVKLRNGGRGHLLWNRITELAPNGKPVYVLRPDEMFLLEEACLHVDRIEQIDRNIDRAAGETGDLYMNGTGGATVANPLLSQRRSLTTTVAGLLKQLALPDLASATGAKSQRQHQSEAAKARWGKTA